MNVKLNSYVINHGNYMSDFFPFSYLLSFLFTESIDLKGMFDRRSINTIRYTYLYVFYTYNGRILHSRKKNKFVEIFLLFSITVLMCIYDNFFSSHYGIKPKFFDDGIENVSLFLMRKFDLIRLNLNAEREAANMYKSHTNYGDDDPVF